MPDLARRSPDGALVRGLRRDGEYVEALWAERVGPDLCRLDNSPFWAHGVSWRDVRWEHANPAHAEPDPESR